MKPILLSSSDYSDSYNESAPTNLKKDLNTTDSESENDDSSEKVVIKTFHPNRTTIKKPVTQANKFFKKPKVNVKIFDLRLDDESSSQESYYSYSYDDDDDDEETIYENHVKTKITKKNINNEIVLETKNLNNDEIDNFDHEDTPSKGDKEENKHIQPNTILQPKKSEGFTEIKLSISQTINETINKEKTKQKESISADKSDQTNQAKEEEKNEKNQNLQGRSVNGELNSQINLKTDQASENKKEEKTDEIKIETNKNSSKRSNKGELSSQIDNQNKELQKETDQTNENKKDETDEIKIETNKNSSKRSDKGELNGQIEEPQVQTKTENETDQSNETQKEEEDDDDVNPPIIKINVFQSKPSITYSIVRTFESSLLTKTNRYSFYLESLQKFYSKTKARNTEQQIPLFEGSTVNFKKKPSYELFADKEFKFFSLKKSDKSDENLMNLKVCIDSLLMLPRHVDIQIFTSPEMTLTTKNPKMSTRGHWVLDFNGRFTIPSERNMIFVSAKEKNGADLIFVRQISNNEIEIDLCTEMDEIFVFAIGMSIFTAKLT